VQRLTHCEWGPSLYGNNIISPGVARQQGRWSIMHTTVKGVCVSYFFDEGTPTSQRRDVALRERHKSDKEHISLVFLSYRFGKYVFRPRAPRYGQASPLISRHSGATRIRLASIQEVCTSFSPLFKRKKKEAVMSRSHK
jgi:hypothetical protein